eukprot:6200273-Pleurochrysis_carterae.AAC.1
MGYYNAKLIREVGSKWDMGATEYQHIIATIGNNRNNRSFYRYLDSIIVQIVSSDYPPKLLGHRQAFTAVYAAAEIYGISAPRPDQMRLIGDYVFVVPVASGPPYPYRCDLLQVVVVSAASYS